MIGFILVFVAIVAVVLLALSRRSAQAPEVGFEKTYFPGAVTADVSVPQDSNKVELRYTNAQGKENTVTTLPSGATAQISFLIPRKPGSFDPSAVIVKGVGGEGSDSSSGTAFFNISDTSGKNLKIRDTTCMFGTPGSFRAVAEKNLKCFVSFNVQ